MIFLKSFQIHMSTGNSLDGLHCGGKQSHPTGEWEPLKTGPRLYDRVTMTTTSQTLRPSPHTPQGGSHDCSAPLVHFQNIWTFLEKNQHHPNHRTYAGLWVPSFKSLNLCVAIAGAWTVMWHCVYCQPQKPRQEPLNGTEVREAVLPRALKLCGCQSSCSLLSRRSPSFRWLIYSHTIPSDGPEYCVLTLKIGVFFPSVKHWVTF